MSNKLDDFAESILTSTEDLKDGVVHTSVISGMPVYTHSKTLLWTVLISLISLIATYSNIHTDQENYH